MGKVTPLKPPPRTDVAAEVAPKLAAARERLGELEHAAAGAALAHALGELGAAGKLAEINRQLDDARREVEQLEGALRLAEQRDAAARAAIDARARRQQLEEMQRHADARARAMVELCEASQKAAAAYIDFLDSTDKMALAMPTGMIPHAISWHMLDYALDGGIFPARVEVVIQGEFFRHGVTRADGRGILPNASPPTEGLRLRPGSIESAATAVARQNEYLLGIVGERLKSIEQANAAKFSKSA